MSLSGTDPHLLDELYFPVGFDKMKTYTYVSYVIFKSTRNRILYANDLSIKKLVQFKQENKQLQKEAHFKVSIPKISKMHSSQILYN